jgi:hypothetical protein
MLDLFDLISRVSQSQCPVLIVGETGTGKELVARTIHQTGPLRQEPFVPVDCAAFVPSLVESELFGHIRGAFTGAESAREGLLKAARGGTVFLDEIGEMPVKLQPVLLRVLQEKEIRPVGSTRREKFTARILAATNSNLEVQLKQGTFRHDLYYRLNVITLTVPPLREHKEDIPILANHFLEECFPEKHCRLALAKEALDCMMDYDWPGNVRELQSCIYCVAILASPPLISLTDLPPELRESKPSAAILNPCLDSVIPLPELKRQWIRKAIAAAQGNKALAAKMLGIGKTTLYRKLKAYLLCPTIALFISAASLRAQQLPVNLGRDGNSAMPSKTGIAKVSPSPLTENVASDLEMQLDRPPELVDGVETSRLIIALKENAGEHLASMGNLLAEQDLQLWGENKSKEFRRYEVALENGHQTFRRIKSNGNLDKEILKFPLAKMGVTPDDDWYGLLKGVVILPLTYQGVSSHKGRTVHVYSYKAYSQDNFCHQTENSNIVGNWDGYVDCSGQVLVDEHFNVLRICQESYLPKGRLSSIVYTTVAYDFVSPGEKQQPLLVPVAIKMATRFNYNKKWYFASGTWKNYRRFDTLVTIDYFHTEVDIRYPQ